MKKIKPRKCPYCGTINNGEDYFCHKCLAELPRDDAEEVWNENF